MNALRYMFGIAVFALLLMPFSATTTTAQLYKTGWSSFHIVTSEPSTRFILGQVFAGRTNGATFGFLPLQPDKISSVQPRPLESNENSISAWPNPAYDKISYSFTPSTVKRSYALYRADGSAVITGSVAAEESVLWLNVETLPQGVFLMVVFGDANVTSVRTSIVR